MFGVTIMVHSWVTASSAPVSSIRKSTTFKSGSTFKKLASIRHQLKLARGVFFIIAFLILFSGFTIVHTFASSDEVTPATGNELVISVDSGDTLWEVARAHKKDSMDTRQAVHAIQQRNGLTTSEVTVGQTLIIPSRLIP